MSKQPRGPRGVRRGQRAVTMQVTPKIKGNSKMIRDATRVLGLTVQFMFDHVIETRDVADATTQSPPPSARRP